MHFEVGKTYSRSDVKELAGLPRDLKGGNWDTGIVEHGDEFIIFTNVGTEGRTGHDYDNRWEGPRLRWRHKTQSSLAWASVQRLLKSAPRIHIFWRADNTASFQYAGLASAVEVAPSEPVEILWAFLFPSA